MSLIREELIKLRHQAYIAAMYIQPEKRRLGIGNALLTKAIEKARELAGLEQIYLMVVTTNVAAKKRYTSHGFKVIGKEERALKFDGDYFDEQHMVLFL